MELHIHPHTRISIFVSFLFSFPLHRLCFFHLCHLIEKMCFSVVKTKLCHRKTKALLKLLLVYFICLVTICPTGHMCIFFYRKVLKFPPLLKLYSVFDILSPKGLLGTPYCVWPPFAFRTALKGQFTQKWKLSH